MSVTITQTVPTHHDALVEVALASDRIMDFVWAIRYRRAAKELRLITCCTRDEAKAAIADPRVW